MATTILRQEGIGAAVFTGIVTHLWFKVREPASLFALLPPLLSANAFLVWASYSANYGLFELHLIYLSAILLSITFYRLSPFHPLAQFPGPSLWKISKLFPAYAAYRDKGKVYARLKKWHEKYGPIVRVGPNELSIVNKEFIPLVLGTSGLPKGHLWEGRLPSNPSGTLNLPFLIPFPIQSHNSLRKSWNKAFAPVPLMNDYAPILVSNASKLEGHLQRLCEKNGEAHVDFAKWMAFFSLDFMGDMAFGGRFQFMAEGDKDGLMQGLESAIAVGSFTQHVPWLGRILSFLSITKDTSKKFREFALEQAKLRFDDAITVDLDSTDQRDLFYHLLTLRDPSDDASDLFDTISDSTLTVLAGSDTTATVLRNIMYFLLAYPQYLQQLRTEIDENFPGEREIDLGKLSSMNVLNGVINETLRLLPALSTSLQRVTPVGRVMENKFIPSGTGITITPYVIHRDTRYFSPHPDEFWPERWYTTSKSRLQSKDESHATEELILDRAAYMPFSFGPGNCVGKSLALLELRYVVAVLVRGFEFAFEGDFLDRLRSIDVAAREKGDVRDEFALSPGSLPVVLSVRRKSG